MGKLDIRSDARRSCSKVEIRPSYTRDDFVRSAWIALAAEDAPLEVFEEDFGEVEEYTHQVFMDSLTVDTSYQTSIGYDRKEPYMDYETYYDKEPYIAYERQYDRTLGQYVERQVTKYKTVQKQRQVTKYRTVTDWSAFSGEHTANSTTAIENTDLEFDFDLFYSSFRGLDGSSLSGVPEAEAATMQVSDATYRAAMEEHEDSIRQSTIKSLPGDRWRDFDWRATNVVKSVTTLYKVPEYQVSITYDGETYTRCAYPFGKMEVGGEMIENDQSPEEIADQMREELEEANNARWSELSDMKSKRRDAIEKKVGMRTAPLSLITIFTLLASILTSVFIRSSFLVITLFIAAVVLFVINTIVVKLDLKAETKRAEKEIAKETARVKEETENEEERIEEEIENYSDNYKAKLLEALNKKLESLGYEPATEDDL